MLQKNTATKQQASASARLMLLFSPIRTITVGSRITLDLLTSVLSIVVLRHLRTTEKITANRALAGLMKSPESSFTLPPVGTFTLP